MSQGMRMEGRELPLAMQEQAAVAIVNQLSQAQPGNMMKCDPRVFARCPYNATCVSVEQAEFREGSDCHKFSEKILENPPTHGDRIRGMNDRELALFLMDVVRCCTDRDCGNCPIGYPNCITMPYWVQQKETG